MKAMFKYLINGSIGMPKELGYKVNYKDINVMINAETIESKKAVSFSGDFEWILSSDDIEIHNVNHSNGIEDVVSKSIYFYRDRGFFEGGFIEPYRLSFISILVEVESLEKLKDQEYFEILSTKVYSILEYFLNTYKVITDNYSISIPDKDKIIGLEVFAAVMEQEITEIDTEECILEIQDISKAKVSKFEARLNSIFANIYVKEPSANGFLVPIPNDEVIEKLIRLLQVGDSPKAYEVILMKAKEELIINNNYLITTILSETAVEVFVQNLLIQLCEANDVVELPMGRNEYMKPYNEAIINGNIKESLIKKYLKEYFDVNVASLREYNDWHTNTYTKRNDIVHKGGIQILKEEAHLAFNSSLNFIKKILEQVENLSHTIA